MHFAPYRHYPILIRSKCILNVNLMIEHDVNTLHSLYMIPMSIRSVVPLFYNFQHLQRMSAPVASSTLCALPYAQEQQQAHTVPSGDSCKAHSVSLGGPVTNVFDQNSSVVGNHISAPVHFPSDHQPVVEAYGTDTDADSSAFTDLSQVSSASRHGHPNTDQISSSSPHQQSPQYSLDLSQVSGMF